MSEKSNKSERCEKLAGGGARQLLGISYSALYTWVGKGYLIPYVQPSGRYLFALDDVLRILEMTKNDYKQRRRQN